MLKRLAAVIWWLGAICTGLPLVLVAIDVYEHVGCADVIAEAAQLEAHEAQAATKRQQEAPPKNGLGLLLQSQAGSATIAASGAIDWATVDRWAHAPVASPEDVQRMDRVTRCKRAPDTGGLLLAFILTLCLWSAAFIVGGRFWLPPSMSPGPQG
jgi:hypothetical protein